MATRNMNHVDKRALVKLIWLTHIEHQHSTSVNARLRFRGLDFSDVRFCSSE